MLDLTYKIEVFEGPLDLLLSLISKNKVDIADIPIALIFEQYMEQVENMRRMDMDVAGEFIVMATELMLIKSKMLLPKIPGLEEEDPRKALALALLEYKHIKEEAEDLDRRQRIYSDRYVKDIDEIPADDNYIRPHSAQILKNAMLRALMRVSEDKEPKPDNIRPIIHRVYVPVSEKIIFVIRHLIKHDKCHIDILFQTARSRSEIVALFMATLELMKAGRISVISYDSEDTSNAVVQLNREKIVNTEENDNAGK